MLKWKTTLNLLHEAGNLESNSINIKCSIFQEDSLSSTFSSFSDSFIP